MGDAIEDARFRLSLRIGRTHFGELARQRDPARSGCSVRSPAAGGRVDTVTGIAAALRRPLLRAALHDCRGRAGTRPHARELIQRYFRIAVRKPHSTTSGPEAAGQEARRAGSRPDSRFASLYQDTLEAPIPQDILSLVEKLGSFGRER
jgi:hypothetical protein